MANTADSLTISDARFHPQPSLRALLQADWMLLLDPSRGRYYALHGVARQVWPLLALNLTVAEIAERLGAPGVGPVVGALLAARLIEPESGGSSRAMEIGPQRHSVG